MGKQVIRSLVSLTMASYVDFEKTMSELLRLDEFPVGLRFVHDDREFEGVARAKRRLYSCQMLKIAGQGGYLHSATQQELSCPHERIVFGMAAITDEDIERQTTYVSNREVARKWFETQVPRTKCLGLIVGPLSKMKDEPDVLALTVNAWQATRCIHAYTFQDGLNAQFVTGPAAIPCAYGAVYVYNSGRPNLVTACSGARRYGKFEKGDLIFFFPFKDIEMFVEGLQESNKNGLTVPLFLDLGYPPRIPKAVFQEPKTR